MPLSRIPATALSGQVPDANIAAVAASKLTGQVPDANAPSGSVIQVVQAVKTDVSTITRGPTDVPGLSLSITPTSASNKILVFWTVQFSANDHASIIINRNSTAIAIGDQVGSSRPRVTHQTYATYTTWAIDSMSGQFLDSPNTTSATTYKVVAWGNDSPAYQMHFNRPLNNVDRINEGTTFCSITAVEIVS
jgi:hypothetical protein